MELYRMRLLQQDNIVGSLGRLINKYFIDMFSRMEDECLQCSHQDLIHWAGGDKDIDCHPGPDCIG